MDIEHFFKNLTPGQYRYMEKKIKRCARDYRCLGKKVAAKRVNYRLDKMITSFLEENPTTCKKGCAHCCYQFLYATMDEAEYIYRYCNENGIPIDWDMIMDQVRLDKDNWISRPEGECKCIFLDNNTCSIYPVRPMACRKYYVSSDPADCNQFAGLKKVAIHHNVEAEILVSGVYVASEPDSLPKQLLKLLKF